VRSVDEQLVKMVETALRLITETEVEKFAERYEECKEVSSIWTVEDLDIATYDVLLHGLNCDHHIYVFVGRDQIVEMPQYTCWVTFEDPEHHFYRRLAHVKVLFIPSLNKCYLEKRIYYIDIRETAEHLVKTAEAQENG